MAKIQCPECSSIISSSDYFCPTCFCSISDSNVSAPGEDQRVNSKFKMDLVKLYGKDSKQYNYYVDLQKRCESNKSEIVNICRSEMHKILFKSGNKLLEKALGNLL